MNQIFIFGAKYLFLIPIILYVLYFYKLEDKQKFLKINALALPLSYILALISRALYYNPRPFVEENLTSLIEHIADNGFPSDHMLLMASLASIMMMFNKKLAYTLWIIGIFVGISRMFVGVHHFLDIMASIILSIVSVLMIYFYDKRNAPSNIGK